MSVLDMVNGPWAITPDMLREIQSIYTARVTGNARDILDVEAALGRTMDNQHKNYEVIDGVAVVPVHGVIAKRANMFSAISGGVSTELVARDIQMAIDDKSVNSILLDIDSPGGSVDGLPELASLIYKARDTKKIVALANGTMASAAYWIGSAATDIYASSETTAVGSIGVVATHMDVSGSEEKRGVKTTEVYAGKFKRISTQYEALTEEGKQSIQGQVDYLYSVFVGAVALHRGMSSDAVVKNMADGRIFIGQQAIDAGLVKDIQTKDQIISLLGGGGARVTGIPQRTVAQANASQEEPTQPTTIESKTMNKEELEKEHPILAAAIRADGASAERDRINDVRAQAMPGHEALVETLAFDGKTTGPEAAVQILSASREEQQKIAANLQSDSPAALKPDAKNQQDKEEPVTTAKSPSAVAEEAAVLVEAAEAKGRTLSFSQAVKQVKASQD